MKLPPLAALACAALLAGCGGSSESTTDRTRTTKPVATTTPISASMQRAARLAALPKRPGEVLVKAGGVKSAGPFKFADRVYRVRFQQFDPDGTTNFSTEASSLVVQLNRRAGEITSETVHVTNATQEHGETQITTHGGRYYVDISSADQGVVVRFTPR